MITSAPVRLISLAVVALIIYAGDHGLTGGAGLTDRVLDTVSGAAAEDEPTTGISERVLDGDTLEVTTGEGKRIQVRILGIAAPEIPHRDQPGECHGAASTRHLRGLLPHRTEIALVADRTQVAVDGYGRWLRYVEVEDLDIGRAQIRAGAALARDSVYPVSRHADYRQVQTHARHRSAGLWSACR